MRIAVEGCAHGELEKIYDTIQYIEKENNYKVDLLLCCGDFQSTRNLADLDCMAVPKKFQDICTFYKYYTGEKVAPMLTIFIGGNHEASNFLQELPYGGWVAKNIYYLGYAGVVDVCGLTIAGLTGIYKGYNFQKGRFEFSPYSEDTKRSVYHVRQLDVFRLKQMTGKVDICLSHDWPRGVYNYGNKEQLLNFKPFFRDEIESNSLGCPASEELLNHIKPEYWFSAHLHCKFSALIPHDDEKSTKFLALDKCLPKRRFLNIVNIGEELSEPPQISWNLEWLTILHLTNHLISVKSSLNYLPNESNSTERFNFTPSEEEKSAILSKFKGNLLVPDNFQRTSPGYKPDDPSNGFHQQQPHPVSNPQTVHFCNVLLVDDPLQLLLTLNDKKFENYVDEATADVVIESIDERKRTSLSLPEPKLISDTNPEEIELDEDTYEPKIEEEIVKDKSPESVLNTSNPNKRFKRRNESIYNADLED